MRGYRQFVVVVGFLLIGFGCSTSNEIRLSVQSYFPLRVGNFQIYDVTETDILHLNCNETTVPTPKIYQVKVLITDSITNAEGGYTYTLSRYTRPDANQEWANLDTRTARVSGGQLVSVEDNVTYVKFIYPLVNGMKWNGNVYNDLTEEDYKAKSVSQLYTTSGGEKFQNTFTVVQNDEVNLIYQDTRLEVYGLAVGLIYKETTQLQYFTDVACFGQQQVKSGTIYKQSLVSYGRE